MNERAYNRVFDIVNIILISVFVLACLAPFFHIISISLSSNRAVTSGEVTLWPIELDLRAYKKVLADHTMITSLGFTIVLTVVTVVLAMAMTILAAYPLMNKKLKGRKLFMMIIVVTMFFSGGMIPEYLLVRDLHLLNSMWALVLPGLISPFYLIILISFFNGIPESLTEAAEIDGSSQFRSLLRIIIPLSMPVLATLSLFYAVGRWNGFQDSLLYITNVDLYPLQLKLYQLVQNNMISDLTRNEGPSVMPATPESLKAASVMFATVPILLVYPWLQRYFVSGVMLGAVKG